MKRLIALCILGLASGAALAQDSCTAYLEVGGEFGQLDVREEFTASNSGDSCSAALAQCQQALNHYQDNGQYLDGLCELGMNEEGDDIFVLGDADGGFDGSIAVGEPHPHRPVIVIGERPRIQSCEVKLLDNDIELRRVYDYRLGRYVTQRVSVDRLVSIITGRGYTKYTACQEGRRLCERERRRIGNNTFRCEARNDIRLPIRRPVITRPVITRPVVVTRPGNRPRTCIPGRPGCM